MHIAHVLHPVVFSSCAGEDRVACIERIKKLEGAILLEVMKIVKGTQEEVKAKMGASTSSEETDELLRIVVAKIAGGLNMYRACDALVSCRVESQDDCRLLPTLAMPTHVHAHSTG